MDRRQQEAIIAELVRSLGTSLRNRGLYPPFHPLVQKPIERCFSDILLFFADREELALAIVDGTLVFEGVPIFSLTSSLEYFMERLARIGAPGVVFARGIAPEELELLIRFLHETAEEGLEAGEIQRRLELLGVRHVRIRVPEEEDDALAARKTYDSALDVVFNVLEDVRRGRIPSGAESERVVRNISGMLKRNRDAMLALTLIKNYDEYTYNHSVNVAVISVALGDALALPESDKVEIGTAGLLHDVGKTQLALDLIRKPGTLTVEEFEEIKQHPGEGFILLGKMSHIRPGSAHLVYEHHMRYDRDGYPARDPGYRRHTHTQIIPVADTYDALTTMRSYQNARSPLEALDLMRKIAGRTLDPVLVDVLARSMGGFPLGTMVRLDTMEVGVVTAAGADGHWPARLLLTVDRAGIPLSRPVSLEMAPGGTAADGSRRRIVSVVNPRLYPPPAPYLLQAAG